MSKQILTLKTVSSTDGIFVRGGSRLIEGVAVRGARVIPDERGRLG